MEEFFWESFYFFKKKDKQEVLKKFKAQ